MYRDGCDLGLWLFADAAPTVRDGFALLSKGKHAEAEKIFRTIASRESKLDKYAGTHGLTKYNGQPVWINAKYLAKLPRNAKVTDTTRIDEVYGNDKAGFTYAFDDEKMTAQIISVNEKSGDPDYILPSFAIRDNKVYTITSIQGGAFLGNYIIKSIYLPPEITYIAEDAFQGSQIENLYYELGSYAEKYAKEIKLIILTAFAKLETKHEIMFRQKAGDQDAVHSCYNSLANNFNIVKISLKNSCWNIVCSRSIYLINSI